MEKNENMFPENEVQMNKSNHGAMLFTSKQVSLPKVNLNISPKSNIIMPFLHKTLELAYR